MTEEEAKTKWCPFSRDVTGAAMAMASFNRPFGPDYAASATCHCIGSACMAWRATDNEAGPSLPLDPFPGMKAAGFCGLAGKP